MGTEIPSTFYLSRLPYKLQKSSGQHQRPNSHLSPTTGLYNGISILLKHPLPGSNTSPDLLLQYHPTDTPCFSPKTPSQIVPIHTTSHTVGWECLYTSNNVCLPTVYFQLNCSTPAFLQWLFLFNCPFNSIFQCPKPFPRPHPKISRNTLNHRMSRNMLTKRN